MIKSGAVLSGTVLSEGESSGGWIRNETFKSVFSSTPDSLWVESLS